MDENFIDDRGYFYMVRCPECKRENWAIAVADGVCAWCGYRHEKALPLIKRGQ